MPLARYSKLSAEETLGRTIDRQWPGEALHVIAECRGDRATADGDEHLPYVRRDRRFVYDPDHRISTPAVFQADLETHGTAKMVVKVVVNQG